MMNIHAEVNVWDMWPGFLTASSALDNYFLHHDDSLLSKMFLFSSIFAFFTSLLWLY